MMGHVEKPVEESMNSCSDKLGKFLLTTVLLTVCQVALSVDSCPFELADGEITEHKSRGFHSHIRISVPPEPPPGQGYPVVFYYHGWMTLWHAARRPGNNDITNIEDSPLRQLGTGTWL